MTDINSMSLIEGQTMPKSDHTVLVGDVAVHSLFGPIFPRANMMTMSGATSIQQITREIIQASQMEDIVGQVVRIDSPGGDVRMISEMSLIVNKLVQSGIVLNAYAEGYFASAAYHFMSSAKLYGNKSSQTGSIGVVLNALKNDDDTIEIVSSISKNKRPNPETNEGRAVLQEIVEDVAEIMVSDIARNRNVTSEFVIENYGQGKTFVGSKALSAGLLDGVAETLSDVVELTAEQGRNKNKTKRKSYVGSTVKFSDAFAEYAVAMSLGSNLITSEGDNYMSLFDKLKGLKMLGTKDPEQPTTEEPKGDERTLVEIRSEMEEDLVSEAGLLAKNLVLSNHIGPDQQANVTMLLLNAKCDDKMFGNTVSLIKDGVLIEGTREELMLSAFESSKIDPNDTKEKIKSVAKGDLAAHVLPEKEEDVKALQISEKERKDDLLAQTPAGRSVINSRKNNK